MDWKRTYNSWRKLWQERHLPEAKPASPEAPAQPIEDLLPGPEGKASEPVNVADLQNSVVALKKERDDLRASLDQRLRPAALTTAATDDVPAINPRASLGEWIRFLEFVESLRVAQLESRSDSR
jgi:hypothetical protein